MGRLAHNDSRMFDPMGKKAYKGQVDKAWFLGQLRDAGLTQEQLGAKLGLAKSAISRILDGLQLMRMSEAVEIAKAFGVPLEEVARRVGIDATTGRTETVPVIGWVGPDGQVRLEKPLGPAWVPGPPNSQAVRFQGGLLDGYSAIYRESSGVPATAVGCACIVQTADGHLWAARIRSGYTPGHWILDPMGNSAPFETTIQWAAKIQTMTIGV